MVNGSPLAWKTSYVGHVCLSTCEAEYAALALASKQAIHTQQIQADLRNLTDEYQYMLSGALQRELDPTSPVDFDPINLLNNNTKTAPPSTDTKTELRRLLATIQVVVREDNQSTINAVTADYAAYLRLRHISSQYHFSRDLHQKGITKVVHVPGKQQLADFLTKTSISAPKFHAIKAHEPPEKIPIIVIPYNHNI